ncbi:N-acetylglucosamine kinase [Salinibacterium sp. NK8237]|uniref:N-acetylglucosamine kinase n=1 Tax=Salinibacterium sp. NK8237 TaxID=2792038 RepID=UPI0018CCB691|nr:BadF/BadG/BcrA/BcrD ATPase family protein [Salinibacterium sp. NK8237]MBH0130416.1 ATPase [Salinibacterium sp. NK8237]
MFRVLAVDGGQSGIRLKSSAQPGTVEVDGVSRLEGDTLRTVAAAITNAWIHGKFEPVDRVVMGLTTSPADAASSTRLAELVAATTGASEVWIADDTVTSHAGALSIEPGVSLITGTGVACLAVRPSGESHAIDGDGYLLGDAGGGFWIGSRGISAVLKELDGRGPSTTLTARAAEHFDGLTNIAARLHSTYRPVNRIAQFARAVLASATAGDAVADAIVTAAAHELFLTARVGVNWVGNDAPLALGGKLLGPNTLLFARLVERLANEGMSFRPADASALEGALLLGTGDTDNLYRDLIYVWKKGSPE